LVTITEIKNLCHLWEQRERSSFLCLYSRRAEMDIEFISCAGCSALAGCSSTYSEFAIPAHEIMAFVIQSWSPDWY